MGRLPCVRRLAPVIDPTGLSGLLGSLGMLGLLLVGRLPVVGVLSVVGLLPCAVTQLVRGGAHALPELPPVKVPAPVDQRSRSF